jgi:hypothetical protein
MSAADRIRWKRLCLIFASIGILGLPSAEAARFTDLSGNWCERYVNLLSDRGIILATPDGKFEPDAPITRAVLAAWMVKALGLQNQPVSSSPSFKDVKQSDWFYKPVEIIRQNNYVSGYADGFRPNQFIQKAEVIVIASRAITKSPPDEATVRAALSRFKDGMRVPEWARIGIAEAAMVGFLSNQKNPETLDATQMATRGEVAALLYQLNEYISQQTVDDKVNDATRSKLTDQFHTSVGTGVPPTGQYSSPDAYQGQNNDQLSGLPANGSTSPYLQGRVAVLEAGTHFEAKVRNTIDSGSTQPGEAVEATLSEPVYSGNVPVIPAGSKVTGEITNVVSARRFHFGANGKVEIKFTQIETPDGRRFPLSASVDSNKIRLTGGTTAGRVGKGLAVTGIGAGSGAVLGTALGAIVGGTAGGPVGRSTGMGAVFGTALGGGVGAVGAGVRKGSEVKIIAGTSIPIQLDSALQVTAARSRRGAPQQYVGSQDGAANQANAPIQYEQDPGPADAY